jgi:hypothetical protein
VVGNSRCFALLNGDERKRMRKVWFFQVSVGVGRTGVGRVDGRASGKRSEKYRFIVVVCDSVPFRAHNSVPVSFSESWS